MLRLALYQPDIPQNTGTLLRLEQSGFRGAEDERFFTGANYGWQMMLARLERVTAGLA